MKRSSTRIRRGAVFTVFFTALLGAPASAVAQDVSAQSPAPDAEARARELFQAGADAMRQGRYESALASFEEAGRLSDRAGLLFNIALAHERLRHDREALAHYERYLAEADDPPNRAEVERRIEVLRDALARSEGAPSGGETTRDDGAGDSPPETGTIVLVPAASDAPSEGSDLLPWVLVAASGGVAVAGAALFAAGKGESSDVSNAMPGASWSDHESAASRGGTFQTIGVVAMAAGLAGVAAGVALLIVGGAEDDEVSVRLAPLGVELRGRF